jgi:hypothetical protein
MSHAALAAVLQLRDLSVGERLAAFSLASFANREHRAWPSTPIAAARAGLSRTQYLAARDRLTALCLIDVEDLGGGRGRAHTLRLRFAETGPWADLDVNPPLLEAVLTHTRTRGPARLLLATLAAIADQDGTVTEISTTELRAAAGIADSTYRRARTTLLHTGELLLTAAGGGRAVTNRWSIPNPRTINPTPITAPRPRPATQAGTCPLMAPARPLTPHEVQLDRPPETLNGRAAELHELHADPGKVSSTHAQSRSGASRPGKGKGSILTGVAEPNPAQSRTVSTGKGPILIGVSEPNPAQDRTVSRQTPPQTPPPNARTGREPQNPRTQTPPNPPAGGQPHTISITEHYLTPTGRRRQRPVTLDLDQARQSLQAPDPQDLSDWRRIRADLASNVGSATFAIWLDPVELICCIDQVLVLACPTETRAWITSRYESLLDRVSRSHGRQLRLASDTELQLHQALHARYEERSVS